MSACNFSFLLFVYILRFTLLYFMPHYMDFSKVMRSCFQFVIVLFLFQFYYCLRQFVPIYYLSIQQKEKKRKKNYQFGSGCHLGDSTLMAACCPSFVSVAPLYMEIKNIFVILVTKSRLAQWVKLSYWNYKIASSNPSVCLAGFRNATTL